MTNHNLHRSKKLIKTGKTNQKHSLRISKQYVSPTIINKIFRECFIFQIQPRI